MDTLPIKTFLEKDQATLVDVRSPMEYAKGHIPGALNIPLFSDEERSKVGLKYMREGKSHAIRQGLNLVGPKMTAFLDKLENTGGSRDVRVYCWRGGMRSSGMAWLFETAGYRTCRLQDGYKAFRNLASYIFETVDICLLGGETGAGKTEVLKELKNLGQQVVDLEALAHHKGSAFGGIAESTQPSTEHFQNKIIFEFNSLNSAVPVFLEDESSYIGRVVLPESLWHKMKRSPIICISVPKEYRIHNLVEVYGKYDLNLLEKAIHKITRKLGGQNAKKTISYLHQGKLDLVADELLRYYDKSYRLLLDRNRNNIVETITVEDPNPKSIAAIILARLQSRASKLTVDQTTGI